jgi:uncharacterized protein (TIGR03790 family)
MFAGSPSLAPTPQLRPSRVGFSHLSRYGYTALVGILLLLKTFAASAGGLGLNVLVVVNQASSNSIEVGNYYCEARKVPPENLVRIIWTGGNTTWSETDFRSILLDPLTDAVTTRQLAQQIDYVVLSMDIPYQVVSGTNINSTTSALFYGLKTNSQTSSTYANTEAAFRLSKPGTNSVLATMITGNTVAEAKQLIEQGAAGDGTFPDAPAVLEKTSDAARNIRYAQFDNAIFNVNVLGRSRLTRTNSDVQPSGPLFGLGTGAATYSVAPGTFVPGALADSLTSYGGLLFAGSGQTTLLAFTAAGAAGSYGTVTEPYADPAKFPSPMDYFYQARGFNLAESYYQSLSAPYLGLIVGDPLSAPFAQPPTLHWDGSNAIGSGIINLSLTCNGSRPIDQVDLFLDGKFLRTVTNIAPTAGNVITISFNGFPVSYTVPAGANITNIAAGLAAAVNVPASSGAVKVQAAAHGDRLELKSLSTNYLAEPWFYVDSTAGGMTGANYSVNYLPWSDPPAILQPAINSNQLFTALVESTPGVPFQLLASTNLVTWEAISTNSQGGVQSLVDADTDKYPRRFYRITAPQRSPRLQLIRAGPSVVLAVQSETLLPYVVEASSNLNQWSPVLTNTTGGSTNVPLVMSPGPRFYRASATLPILPAASVSVTNYGSGAVIGVSNAQRAFTLSSSPNSNNWTVLLTNSVLVGGGVSVESTAGTASLRSVHANTPQSHFVSSTAQGWRSFSASGSSKTNTWLVMVVTKTNGQIVSSGITNTSGTNSLAMLGSQLFNAINAEPLLQSADGVYADDFVVDFLGKPSFHLLARSGGLAAANVRAQLSASSGIGLSPGTQVSLTQNLSDLQPRAHVYIASGLTTLTIPVALETTGLADGFHQLSAVGYEGTSVRTESADELAVEVHNTSLAATLTRLDLPDTAPANGTYHLQVSANTNIVSTISLYSTGGLVGVATNQNPATFTVDGLVLGLGLHPFYALVQTPNGAQFRTPVQKVRLLSSP